MADKKTTKKVRNVLKEEELAAVTGGQGITVSLRAGKAPFSNAALQDHKKEAFPVLP